MATNSLVVDQDDAWFVRVCGVVERYRGAVFRSEIWIPGDKMRELGLRDNDVVCVRATASRMVSLAIRRLPRGGGVPLVHDDDESQRHHPWAWITRLAAISLGFAAPLNPKRLHGMHGASLGTGVLLSPMPGAMMGVLEIVDKRGWRVPLLQAANEIVLKPLMDDLDVDGFNSTTSLDDDVDDVNGKRCPPLRDAHDLVRTAKAYARLERFSPDHRTGCTRDSTIDDAVMRGLGRSELRAASPILRAQVEGQTVCNGQVVCTVAPRGVCFWVVQASRDDDQMEHDESLSRARCPSSTSYRSQRLFGRDTKILIDLSHPLKRLSSLVCAEPPRHAVDDGIAELHARFEERWMDLVPSIDEWVRRVCEDVGGVRDVVVDLVGYIRDALESLADARARWREAAAADPSFVGVAQDDAMVPCRKNVLIHSAGISGAGKTCLARSIARHSTLPTATVCGADVYRPNQGETEAFLRDAFERAAHDGPSILIVDDIEAICASRAPHEGSLQPLVERRVCTAFLWCLDGVDSTHAIRHGRPVIVIGIAGGSLDALDEGLLHPARLGDKVVRVPVATPGARMDILQLLTRGVDTRAANLQRVARESHGFVAADLVALVKEAAMHALDRSVDARCDDGDDGESVPRLLELDFEFARKRVRPALLAEYQSVPRGTITFSNIGSLELVIAQLRASVEAAFPQLKYVEEASYHGAKDHPTSRAPSLPPPRGVLLHGPPGTGKTMMAQALAREYPSVNFICIRCTDIVSAVQGESEKRLKELFVKARASAPCILFLDQLEQLARRRDSESSGPTHDRLLSSLLVEMDGLAHKRAFDDVAEDALERTLLVAATNRLDMVDPAILRPGRFDVHLLFSVPGESERIEILRAITKNMPVFWNIMDDRERADDDDDDDDDAARIHPFLRHLGRCTRGLVGAELANVCREAAMLALGEDMDCKWIGERHFTEALRSLSATRNDE